ncbi:ferredoxin [Pseudonocardia sp. C8]|uniref:ferredoxin n=1 Tax=Pseudonocardia sp. C8 TaxID=2762759 RepID=UPI001642CA5B|nr:ferredoxin [Pseudonocardia sp. C8]MBC3189500.1 ferredoxin [Pseudonocardia sp. C8]
MRLVVDLNRCQSYGQCVFAAPEVFRFRGEESLEYDHVPDETNREDVQRAVAACPVQAIRSDRVGEHAVAPARQGEGRS